MVLDGQNWRAALQRHQTIPHDPFIRTQLETYRRLGFTHLRDGGDRWAVGLRAKQLAPEYGITYLTPLAPLVQAGHYGSFIGTTYETIPEYTALVRSHRQNGADFIKIMVSGLMDFDHPGALTDTPLPPRQIRELVHIAHSEGMAVMAHCNGARTMEFSAQAGVDSIEHGAYADPDALQAMRQAGTIWVPTISTIANLRGTGRFDEGAVREILAIHQQNITAFAAMGGLIACGTDAGAFAVLHGSETEETLLGQIPTLSDFALQYANGSIFRRFTPA
jgi:hypothetical protein